MLLLVSPNAHKMNTAMQFTPQTWPLTSSSARKAQEESFLEWAYKESHLKNNLIQYFMF